MGYNHTELDALYTARDAVKKYKEKLDENIQRMIDAGQACDIAMGSDKVSQRYITEMEKTIRKLMNESKAIGDLYEQIEDKIIHYDTI